jgi:hypothetical protein
MSVQLPYHNLKRQKNYRKIHELYNMVRKSESSYRGDNRHVAFTPHVLTLQIWFNSRIIPCEKWGGFSMTEIKIIFV